MVELGGHSPWMAAGQASATAEHPEPPELVGRAAPGLQPLGGTCWHSQLYPTCTSVYTLPAPLPAPSAPLLVSIRPAPLPAPCPYHCLNHCLFQSLHCCPHLLPSPCRVIFPLSRPEKDTAVPRVANSCCSQCPIVPRGPAGPTSPC